VKDWIIAVNNSYQFIEIVIFHYNNPCVSLHVRICDTVWRRNFREVRSQIARDVLVTENMNLEKFIFGLYVWIFGPRELQDHGIHCDLATFFRSNLQSAVRRSAFFELYKLWYTFTSMPSIVLFAATIRTQVFWVEYTTRKLVLSCKKLYVGKSTFVGFSYL